MFSHFLRNALGLSDGRRREERARILTGQAAVLSNRLRYASLRRLWDSEVSVFSQFGEDGILDYLCETLELPRPTVVEFGVGDFTECNSRFLAETRCANVLAVDSYAGLVQSLRKMDVAWKTDVRCISTWLTPQSAAELLIEAHAIFGTVDILSVDLDGNDFWILDALDLTGIAIVVVEYNLLFGPDATVSIPQRDDFSRQKAHYSYLYFGASLRAMTTLMAKRGFSFIGSNRQGNNAFFVRTESFHHLSVDLPTDDFGPFTDWRVREARDSRGRLTFRKATDVSDPSLLALPVQDTVTGQVLLMSEVIQFDPKHQ